jgi:elongation factor Ts
VPADVIEAARKEVLEDPSMARVPESKREEVLSGKLKKAFSTQVLMMQSWVKDEAVTVGDLVRKVIADTGENIVVRRFTRYKLGE